MHEQIKVAAGGASDAGLALTGDSDPGAFVDARRNLDGQLALAERAALAVAIAARVADHFARSPAVRATALDHEKSLLRTDFTHAAASLAGVGAAIGLGAAPAMAHFARRHGLDRDA